jgi:hypothetical protein
VKIDGEDLLIMKEEDIMGVVDTSRAKSSGTATARKVGAVAAVLALGFLATLPFVTF